MALKFRIKEVISGESSSEYTIQTKGIPGDLFYVLFTECWWWWFVPILNFFMLASLFCTLFESMYWKQKGLWVSNEETYKSMPDAYKQIERMVSRIEVNKVTKVKKVAKVKKQIKYHEFKNNMWWSIR